MRKLFSATFLVLSVTAAAAAETPRQMEVFLGDLNLSRPAGLATAQARIHAAAVQLCGSVRDTVDLPGWANSVPVSEGACIAQAVEGANAQVARFAEAN